MWFTYVTYRISRAKQLHTCCHRGTYSSTLGFTCCWVNVYHRHASVWCRVSHRAALGTDPYTTTDSLGEARRAGIEPRASLEFNRRATNVKKCFVSSKSRRVPMPSDSASEPTRVNLIRPAPSRDAIVREFTAPASPVTRGWFIREPSSSPKVTFLG